MHSPAPFPAHEPPVPALQTHVQLYRFEGKQEHWLRFGAPVSDTIIDRQRRNLTFDEGQIFAFVRWASNEYGTIRSLLDIVRCVRSGEPFTTLAGVDPGGDILLSISGWPKVEGAFKLIDDIEALGIDPCDVASDHWRHVHNRIAIAQRPRNYSPARHRAWLQRKALLP